MRIEDLCVCRIFRMLPHFSHISVECAYRIFFPHKLAFSTSVFILFLFLLPISIRFRYLDHLVANRMEVASSMCLDPCGTRWGSWFQAVLRHISAYVRRILRVYAVRIFFKCRTKLTCLAAVASFTCIGTLGTLPPNRTGPLARKYLLGFPYS